MFKEIPLSEIIVSKNNVRKDLSNDTVDSSIASLAENIKQNGLINPICVNIGTGLEKKYTVYAGQRRFLAIKQLGWKSVMCKVTNLDPEKLIPVTKPLSFKGIQL